VIEEKYVYLINKKRLIKDLLLSGGSVCANEEVKDCMRPPIFKELPFLIFYYTI
jgi:hypothetical protein